MAEKERLQQEIQYYQGTIYILVISMYTLAKAMLSSSLHILSEFQN